MIGDIQRNVTHEISDLHALRNAFYNHIPVIVHMDYRYLAVKRDVTK